MPKYSVRVLRTYPEDDVDLDVEADTPEEASDKAEAEAKARCDYLFGATPDPSIHVDPSMEPDEIE